MRIIKNCRVLVKKNSQDCTGGGISAHYDTLTLLTDVPYTYTTFMGKQYYERPDEQAIEKYCTKKEIDPRTVLILCDKVNNPIYTPYVKPLDSVWGVRDGQKLTGPCAGGHYLLAEINDETGWKEMIWRIHDRYDTQEVWDALSR